jgi:DNA polymerase-3 subunit gamma/tau
MFATTEPHKVPPTVLSRCQAFWLQPIPEELIAKRVEEIAKAEGFALGEGAAALLARRAGGSLRDALVLLEQLGRAGPITPEKIESYLGLPPRSQIDAFLSALLAKDSDTALEIVADLSRRGRDLALFVEEALARARDRVVAGEDQLLPLLPSLVELRAQLPRAFSRKLHLELFVLEKCGAPKRSRSAEETLAQSPKEAVISDQEPPDSAPSTEKSNPIVSEEPIQEENSRSTREQAEEEDVWEKFLRAAYEKRADLGVFLAPAEARYADGILRIVLPQGFRYHYESLREKEVFAALEEVARQFYDPLLAVEVLYAGDDGPQALTLEEAARLLAEALEGKIITP